MQPWAYTAIECYGCSSCDTYPLNPIAYTNMTMWGDDGMAVTPAWVPHQGKYHWCNEAATVASPEDVTFTFQK